MEENHSDSIVEFLLTCNGNELHADHDDFLNIDENDIKSFLYVTGRRQVEYTDEAEAFIKHYFLATRFLRPGIN